MALQGVPLYIANDTAQHGGPASRSLVHAAYRGIEGVLNSTDFRVQETATPGGSVDVLPGVYSALARGPGQDLQSYEGTALTTTNVSIPATDSSGSRSDLIVVQVEDPNDGTGQWSTPSDAVNGPYEHIRRIDNVPAGTTSIHDLSGSIGTRNAVTLARIDLPSSTGTVTDSEITDLRNLAAALELSDTLITPAGSGSTLSAGASFQVWPTEASWTLRVPPWATSLVLAAWFTPQMFGHAWGALRFVVDGSAATSVPFDDNYSDPTGDGGGMRLPLMVGADVTISSGQQGSDISIQIEGEQQSSTGSGLTVGDQVANRGTTIVLQYAFKQELA